MKKALKIIGVIFAVSAVLLVISSLALHLLLPPEKAKALVLKQMTAQLKREVTLGDVSVGVLSGLSVSDLKVSESPNFSKGTFISSDQFSIRLALLPLLFRRVEVKQLILKHPMIQIVRYADGKTFNFSDLMAPTPVPSSPLPARTSSPAVSSGGPQSQPGGSPQDNAPPFLLLISRAQIQNGVIHFVDRSSAQQSLDIDPLDLKLKNVSMTSPFTVQADLQVKAKGIAATLKLAGEADLATESFKVKTCSLASGGSTVELSGKASHLRSSQPSVDLTLGVKEFKLSTLAPFAALPPALKLEGPIVANARIKGDQRKINLSIQADLGKVQVIYGKQFHKPAGTPMGLSLTGDLASLQDLNLTDMKLVLGSLQLNVHGKVVAAATPQPQVNLHLETNAFSVAELMGLAAVSLPPGVSMKGKAQLSADVSGTQTSSRIAAKFDGKNLELASGDTFRKPIDLPMRVSLVGERVRQTLTLQSVSATLGSIELNGNGTVVTSVTPPKFQLVLKSKPISLQEAARLSPLAAEYKLAGTAVVDVHASGTADVPVANGSLALQDASLHYQQSDLTHISTTLTFTQQDVSIPKLTGKLNGSDIALKMTGHRLTTQPDIAVEANVTELDLAKLLPPLQSSFPPVSWNGEGIVWAAAPPVILPPAKLSGHLTVGHIKHDFYDAKNLDFKWDLTDVTPDLSRVNGMTTLNQGPGQLQNIEDLAARSTTARVGLSPVSVLQKLDKAGVLRAMGVPSLQTITFTKWHGDYALHSGIMDVKIFDLEGPISINTSGTIGLAGSQPLNMHATIKLPPGTGGNVGQFVADESGRPTLPFTIQGTVSHPDAKPDMRKVVGQIGQQLFKGLGLGGGQSAAPSSGNASNSQQPQQAQPQQAAPPAPPPNPVDDLQKALKNFHF